MMIVILTPQGRDLRMEQETELRNLEKDSNFWSCAQAKAIPDSVIPISKVLFLLKTT
jgi:hypothetical protein